MEFGHKANIYAMIRISIILALCALTTLGAPITAFAVPDSSTIIEQKTDSDETTEMAQNSKQDENVAQSSAPPKTASVHDASQPIPQSVKSDERYSKALENAEYNSTHSPPLKANGGISVSAPSPKITPTPAKYVGLKKAARLARSATTKTQTPTKTDVAALTAIAPQDDPVANNANPTADKTYCDESFTYANALMRAENAYVRRRYTTVLELLKPIYENIQCIDDSVTVIEIDLLMGVAHNELGRQALADSFFLNVLRASPDHIVGSIITIPESSARRIEQLRADHAEELNALRAQTSPDTIIESLYILVEKEHHPFWVNFLPFGAGQFQMRQTTWGIVYASTQVAGIVLSILGGAMVEYYRGDTFTYSPQDRAHAKNWQNAQIVGISLLTASYVASVIHAIIIHEDSTLIIHSPSQTRPDIAHRAAPFLLPDGAGLVYSSIF